MYVQSVSMQRYFRLVNHAYRVPCQPMLPDILTQAPVSISIGISKRDEAADSAHKLPQNTTAQHRKERIVCFRFNRRDLLDESFSR